MYCPKCKNRRFKYDVPRNSAAGGKGPLPRTDFHATCNQCGYKGVER